MKIFKVLGLILVSFILVNCDNSKPAPSDSSSSNTQQSSANDYSASQDLVISEVKKQLPIEIDELTTLVDVSKGDNFINYKYNVKGTPKEVLLLPETQKVIRDNLEAMYCSNSQEIKALKSFFPNGANYTYYINDEQVSTLQITPAACAAK